MSTRKLLTAQVVLTDKVDKIADKLAVSVQELRDAQKHADERLNTFITVVDGLFLNRPSL